MQIEVNLELMELMIYYWQATSEREKVSESYLLDIASHNDMKAIYDREFGEESVRRALSAITNKERFSSDTKKEARFWSNNMWAMEDLDFMMSIFGPIKQLNLEKLASKFSLDDRKITIHFVPGHTDLVYKVKNDIYINFFLVKSDLYEENKITIEDKEIPSYIESQI